MEYIASFYFTVEHDLVYPFNNPPPRSEHAIIFTKAYDISSTFSLSLNNSRHYILQ